MTGFEEQDATTPLGEASTWIVRLQGEALTEADAVGFDAWLDAMPENRAAYATVLAALGELERAGPEILSDLEAAPAARRRPNAGRRWWIGSGAAAAAAALVAVLILPGQQGRPTQTYATGRGQHLAVRLADGSALELNAETRLEVSFAPDRRHVMMHGGEVIFDVAADARRPFEIEAAGEVVRVVGTRFDVRDRPEGLAVVVARGVVQVRPGAGAAAPQVYVLHPGQRLDIAAAARPQLSTVNPEEALGWRNGRMVYRDEPLSRVVADLNRQFLTPIAIEDPALGRQPISGVLIVDDQDAVLQRLALMLPIKTVRSDRGVVLRPR